MIIDEQELLRIAKLSGFDIYPEDNEVWFNCEYDLTENIHMFVDLLEKSIKQKPLSDEKIIELWLPHDFDTTFVHFAREIEKAHDIGVE